MWIVTLLVALNARAQSGSTEPDDAGVPIGATDAAAPVSDRAPSTSPPAAPEVAPASSTAPLLPDAGPPGAASAAATSPPPEGPPPPRLLAPRYPEDYYPGMPEQEGVLNGIPIDAKRGLRFAMHGYFRAPMRLTKTGRPEGTTKPNEGDSDWHSPFLIDDDYFLSGFAYTPLNETDYAELYLSVGNDKVTGTIGMQGSLFSDAAKPISTRQPGLSQGWVTYRTDLDFIPVKTKLRVKAGAFWDRFGHLPKYDTYIFARTHQMGEQIRFDVEAGDFSFWALHGIGTHLEDLPNQGLTFLNYGSIGASYKQTVELGGYLLDSRARDKRLLTDLTDSFMSVVGVDLRADTHYAGHLYGATSLITAEQAKFQGPMLESMHSLGGAGIFQNYLGPDSENGTGSLWNVGFQYDLSAAETYRGLTGKRSGSPLPWNGDLTASVFGLYTFVQSKQKSPDPIINRDDRKSFKWGVEGGYRVTEWMGLSCRYDRVVLDVDDSANSFRILSPRLSFFTSLLTRETIFLQYSRYMYNERIRLRDGQVQGVTMPNDHVVKLQAQMTF